MGFKADLLHSNKSNFVFWEIKVKLWDFGIYWAAIAAQCTFNFSYECMLSKNYIIEGIAWKKNFIMGIIF